MPNTSAGEPSSGRRTSPGGTAPARQARVVLALSFAAIAGAALWGGVGPSRTASVAPIHGVYLLGRDRPFPPSGRYPRDPYVGPLACAECHPGEYALYTRSGHARTLSSPRHRVIASQLDGKSIEDPDQPEVFWSYHRRNDELFIRRVEKNKIEECVAEYAFGSGHHGTTFVSVVDPKAPAILEHRISYYTGANALGLTAGQNEHPRPPGLGSLGRVMPPDAALKCFGCHTTQLSARDDQAIDEETMIPNVSCERCHGPGRAHVEAARRRQDAEMKLPFGPNRFTTESLILLCGTCHRHPSNARPDEIRPDDPHLVRFQPVGLLQSRCYRESAGAFSCLSCHDPHARVASDRASYLAICLSCHRGPAGKPDSRGAACPVEPRGDCIDCHMPRVDAGQHILFTDHWIRVRHEGESMLPLNGPSSNLKSIDAPTGPEAPSRGPGKEAGG